jgi:hypothetical protein
MSELLAEDREHLAALVDEVRARRAPDPPSGDAITHGLLDPGIWKSGVERFIAPPHTLPSEDVAPLEMNP